MTMVMVCGHQPAHADRQPGPSGAPLITSAAMDEAGTPPKPSGRGSISRLPGLAALFSGSHREGAATAGWGPGWAGLAVVLGVGGGVAVAIRRFVPPASTGAVHVVGRVSLSPKHSVYLIRVGRRVLLVGTGPQGPPSLISELDDPIGSAPNQPQDGDP
jgi:hypothetical protein